MLLSPQFSLFHKLLSALKPLFVLCSLLAPVPGVAQNPVSSQTSIRVNSSLVLVDVITQDAKTKLPFNDLQKEDFQVFDNGSEMDIRSFDVGARYSTRPIALWLVVICNERNWDENGSGFIRGKTASLRPALNHLDKNDTVGVAHWCDNGTQKIDFAPSRDLDGALAKLEELFHEKPKGIGTRPGELALQRMLRLILDSAHLAQLQPLPVIVFLYGDHSGMAREEADDLLKNLLETSGIVFGINDGAVPVSPIYLGNQHAQPNVAHFLAAKTGGQFFSVSPQMFSTELDEILVRVHFRYVLGFQPPVLDGKWHTLKVQLTDSATAKYPDARLAFRPAYIPVAEK